MAVSASPLAWTALAAGARAPVCCLVGDGGRARARTLRLDARVRVVSSPRHATVVVVVGELPPPLHAAALQVHDQVPGPRGVVVWAGGRGEPFPEAVRVEEGGDVGAAIVALHRALVRGEHPLELAERAGDSQRSPGAPLEGPRGTSEARAGGAWLELLAEVACGQAWDAFVTTLVSLDLDPAALPVTGEYEQAPDEGEHGHETEQEDDEDEDEDEEDEDEDRPAGAYACPK